MSERHTDVLIAGAGLSGLACARVLRRAGLRPLILEGSDGVGGSQCGSYGITWN
jgi:flavin-dependent dehydrogenase